MKKTGLLFLGLVYLLLYTVNAHAKKSVPLDSIRLSDPCILADTQTKMYYMTGTGGKLWKSKDLKFWDGPYDVAQIDPRSWMGPKPMIWAAELHHYKDKYYYFATFTNTAVKIDTVKGNVIERRASHVLVSDKPDGGLIVRCRTLLICRQINRRWMERFGWILMESLTWCIVMSGCRIGMVPLKRLN